MPAGIHGPHFTRRRPARHEPLSVPYLEIEDAAYRLQVGSKRHFTPASAKEGETDIW